MRAKRTSYSIDYVIKILFIFLLPVVILDIILSCYVIYSMRVQTIQSLQDTTSLYVSQIDTTHISINKYLIRRLGNDMDFQTVLKTEDNLELIQACENVRKDVDTFTESFDGEYQIFLYSPKQNRMFRPTKIFPSVNANELESINQELISYMKHHLETSTYSDAWNVMTLNCGVYFFKIFRSDYGYAGSFVSAESIIQPLRKNILSGKSLISFTDKKGTPLTNIEELQKLNINFPVLDNNTSSQINIRKNHLIISGPLTMGVFRPQIILNKFNAYEKIIVLQFVMAGVILLISAILFSSMIYMRRKILTPIKQFSENLLHYNEHTELINVQNTQIRELEQANIQFKNLMHQIKKLKIDIYEKELEKQKTLMNYLQLQIRPHFFLNCLNTIYSMAQTQLYSEIMKMTIITSDYFRYIFQNPQDFVPVCLELKHIENYMKIQKLRFGNSFEYEIYAEEGTEDILILPILIQTFIENSLKHSSILDKPITIRTDVEWAYAKGDSHGNIQIQITDTGVGFPEEILNQLNSPELLSPVNGHRIGITNAIKRLRIFYENEEAAITFSNLSTGGACVTILLPVIQRRT